MCRCRLCKQHRILERLVKKYAFTKRELAFMDDYICEADTTGLDRDVLQSVMDGTWPSALEQLSAALGKAVVVRSTNKEKA